jgi:hypothetical protein
MFCVKHILKFLILFLISLVYLSCSSSQGPLFKKVTNIPPHQSVIYLFRSNDKVNSEFLITCNNKEVCLLENNGYFPYLVNEGKVVIRSFVQFKFFATGLLDLATADSSMLIFKADAGKSYYVECTSKESNKNELKISLVPENYGSIKIKECPPA